MDCGSLLRAVRRAHRFSQRELAQVTGVAHSTIERIESGQSTRPGIVLIDHILRTTGFMLVVADQRGRPLVLDSDLDRLFDFGGRHFPAHLPVHQVDWLRNWWGWFRIAWAPNDPKAPAYSYRRRLPHLGPPWAPEQLWIDAT